MGTRLSSDWSTLSFLRWVLPHTAREITVTEIYKICYGRRLFTVLTYNKGKKLQQTNYKLTYFSLTKPPVGDALSDTQIMDKGENFLAVLMQWFMGAKQESTCETFLISWMKYLAEKRSFGCGNRETPMVGLLGQDWDYSFLTCACITESLPTGELGFSQPVALLLRVCLFWLWYTVWCVCQSCAVVRQIGDDENVQG